MSDSEDLDMERILKKRAAVNRWKAANYDRYLLQKRTLAARPEYKAHRREMYREKTEELKSLGILPRKRGRPQMYEGSEAIEMKRRRAREAMARYRLRIISQLRKIIMAIQYLKLKNIKSHLENSDVCVNQVEHF